jgi:hypothetical protein
MVAFLAFKKVFATKSGIIPIIVSSIIMIIIVIMIDQTTLSTGYKATLGILLLTVVNVAVYTILRKKYCSEWPDEGCQITKGLSYGYSGVKNVITGIN